ncbi:MAG: NAD(P)-binding domain-containing protein [Terracidiphilus sp.]|nr:NAD(P)-binding domain-containing protein [Terracidiphilus sp.]MDR3776911.1 NAD(P)-binding domain-containing protein [Terracidiphilus sp.]
MTYAILGAGNVGKALAKAFARKNMEVTLASRRSADEFEPVTRAIGPKVFAKSLQEAVKADVILLAVPFKARHEVAKAAASWKGKLVIDVTNAYGVPRDELGNRPSSAVIAEAFAGAVVVKAFNHLPAEILAQDPQFDGMRRVLFLSSDDTEATAKVAAIVKELGYAPVALGKLAEGGLLIQAQGNSWAQLIFQDLLKKEE